MTTETKPKVVKHRIVTGLNKVYAMQLEDGRVGVVCATTRHAWLTHTWEDAVLDATRHVNNLCELRDMLSIIAGAPDPEPLADPRPDQCHKCGASENLYTNSNGVICADCFDTVY